MERDALEKLHDDDLVEMAISEGIRLYEGIDREEMIDLILEAIEEDRMEREALNNLQMRLEAKKYGLHRERKSIPEQKVGHIDNEDTQETYAIPAEYNITRIVLLLRDPSWGFAYWDISKEYRRKFKGSNNNRQLLIRVYRQSDVQKPAKTENEYYDIEIQPEDRCWYINLPEQGYQYRVCLILIERDQETIIARSNSVCCPVVKKQNFHAKNNGSAIGKIARIAGFYGVYESSSSSFTPQRIIASMDTQFFGSKE